MRFPTSVHKRLIAAGLLDSNTAFQAKPLTGGYWNQVYRLQSESHDWVVKHYSTSGGNKMYPILPGHEAQALKDMGRYGISPKFVQLIPDQGDGAILVYEFVQGPMWSGDYFGAGRLLARSHAIPIRGSYRTRPTTPEEILTHADQIVIGVPTDSPAMARYLNGRPALPLNPILPIRTNALIHTDCGPGNIVMGSDGPILIDWQCPGTGDPAEDVITFINPGMQILYGFMPMRSDQEALFYQGYGAQATLDHARKVEIYYHYRIAAYCAVRNWSTAESDPRVSDLYLRAFEATCDRIGI